ncbi:MAG: GGDEF domain-containing protein [Proteobacteria bacterium]|nr:GGDEF domain-containing protein [Pseudomonadota bacterium]
MLRISEMRNKLVSLTRELFDTNNQLQQSVITDPLTGAKNRLYLDECMNREWYRGMRNKTTMSILLIDIDHFKTLNDTNGHQAGDKCLVEIVKVIKSNLKRATDELCRYGGDEFVVILPDTSATNAMRIAETIRESVEKYNSGLGEEITVDISVSIGCASCIPNDKLTTDEFINFADKALYTAKDAGRNSVVKAEISENKSIAA